MLDPGKEGEEEGGGDEHERKRKRHSNRTMDAGEGNQMKYYPLLLPGLIPCMQIPRRIQPLLKFGHLSLHSSSLSLVDTFFIALYSLPPPVVRLRP